MKARTRSKLTAALTGGVLLMIMQGGLTSCDKSSSIPTIASDPGDSGLAVVQSPISSASALGPPNTPIRIFENVNYSNLRICGHYVLIYDKDISSDRFFDLSTGHEVSGVDQCDLSVDRKVYTKIDIRKYYPDPENTPDIYIYLYIGAVMLYDYSTQEEIQITPDSVGCRASEWEQHYCNTSIWKHVPQISGDYVVWVDERGRYNGTSDLYELFLYDISTQSEEIIAYVDYQIPPVLEGSYVAWIDNADNSVNLYDIETGAKSQIGISYGFSLGMSGDRIVWVKRGNILLYNISTGVKTWITQDDVNVSHAVLTVQIDGDLIVYYDNGPVDDDRGIYLYDLANGTEVKVAGQFAINHDISGNHVVWADDQLKREQPGYNSDIYYYEYVRNQPPIAHPGDNYAVEEGTALTFDGSGSLDPDGDALTYAWDFDYDGTNFSVEATGSNPSHTYPEDGDFMVALRVDDGTSESEIATTTVTVSNQAPRVDVISGIPDDPVPLGTTISVSALFADPGILDTHTGQIDWDANGASAISAAIITETDGAGAAGGSHTYMDPGVYTIQLTVTDDEGDSAERLYQYVVVYNPERGFVTGNGRIHSAEGAYAADPSLSGEAKFGFVAKYQRGTNIPDGNTRFEFKAGDFKFSSTSYDWLVVAGARAQFKGTGTINGEGFYNFMISAVDGALTGSDDIDTFRIKIWNNVGVMYDNQFGEADDAQATTEVTKGSIVIHKQGV